MSLQYRNAEKRTLRGLLTEARNRAARAARQHADYIRNIVRAPKTPPATDERVLRRNLMHSMSGWQRNNAMKECKGNLGALKTERMRYWATAKHWKQQA